MPGTGFQRQILMGVGIMFNREIARIPLAAAGDIGVGGGRRRRPRIEKQVTGVDAVAFCRVVASGRIRDCGVNF